MPSSVLGLRICISNRFPGKADATCSGTTSVILTVVTPVWKGIWTQWRSYSRADMSDRSSSGEKLGGVVANPLEGASRQCHLYAVPAPSQISAFLCADDGRDSCSPKWSNNFSLLGLILWTQTWKWRHQSGRLTPKPRAVSKLLSELARYPLPVNPIWYNRALQFLI